MKGRGMAIPERRTRSTGDAGPRGPTLDGPGEARMRAHVRRSRTGPESGRRPPRGPVSQMATCRVV